MENSMAEKSSYHSPGYTLAAMCPSSFQKQTNRTPKVMPISLDSTFVSEAPSWSIRALPTHDNPWAKYQRALTVRDTFAVAGQKFRHILRT